MWLSRTTADSGPTALIVEDEPALYHELRELLETLWPELAIIGHAAMIDSSSLIVEAASTVSTSIMRVWPVSRSIAP